jgi:hypothetical protein
MRRIYQVGLSLAIGATISGAVTISEIDRRTPVRYELLTEKVSCDITGDGIKDEGVRIRISGSGFDGIAILSGDDVIKRDCEFVYAFRSSIRPIQTSPEILIPRDQKVEVIMGNFRNSPYMSYIVVVPENEDGRMYLFKGVKDTTDRAGLSKMYDRIKKEVGDRMEKSDLFGDGI